MGEEKVEVEEEVEREEGDERDEGVECRGNRNHAWMSNAPVSPRRSNRRKMVCLLCLVNKT